MSLVDIQDQQLQCGLKYVQQLRAQAKDHQGTWGEVGISHPSSLRSTLKDAWLVIEVCCLDRERMTVIINGDSVCLRNCRSSKRSLPSSMILLQRGLSLPQILAAMESVRYLLDST